MSISDPKTRAAKSTAANALAADSNFAIPPKLGAPSSPVAGHKRRSITDREFALVQASSDFVCACIALPLSLLILSLLSAQPVNDLSQIWRNSAIDCLFPVSVVIALALGGTYRVTHQRLQPSAFLEIRELSFGVGAGAVLALGLGSLAHVTFDTAEPYSTQLVMAVIVSIVVISVGRIVLRYFLHTLTSTRVLVVGTGNMADRIMFSVRQDPGMTLVGQATDGDTVDAGAVGRVADLPQLCRRLDVHRILVTPSNEFSSESLDTFRQLQDSVHIAMVPHYYELISWRSRLTDLSGMPFLEIARPHLSKWDQFMKRAFDLSISSAVLLITSPLLLLVAAGVKISSPGPVFFRQVRLGRHQQQFTLTKFRSMTVGGAGSEGTTDVDLAAEEPDRPLHEVRGKLDESGRITRFGAFLRQTGIDEIPQFINVFKGDMSVVGPRPFIPKESRVDGWATRRFDVRPGITGLWQVSGRNDLSRNDLVQLDYLYVASWSLWWDLKIMWETPKTMALGRGAY
jgi:exopolysaccharide biosynthesis polyprenyl glycosylphosphotransferase